MRDDSCPFCCHAREATLEATRGKLMVSSPNSHTNATRVGWHLWEIDLRFAPGLPPGWGVDSCCTGPGVHQGGSAGKERRRGGLVFKAHRLVYQSTLGWRVIKKKKKERRRERGCRCVVGAGHTFEHGRCRVRDRRHDGDFP